MANKRDPIWQEPNSSFVLAIDLLRNTFAQKASSKENDKRGEKRCDDKAERGGEDIGAVGVCCRFIEIIHLEFLVEEKVPNSGGV